MKDASRILVVNRSHYGHSRSYAQWLAEDLGSDLADLDESSRPSLVGVGTVVFVAPIYAGGLYGSRQFDRLAKSGSGVTFVGVTVGATDPTNPLNQNAYREVIKSVLPDSLTSTMVWFHLRGGIDFPKLKPVHRILMQLSKPRTRRAATCGDAEAQFAYESYGKVVDFRDRNSIRPIVSYIESMHR